MEGVGEDFRGRAAVCVPVGKQGRTDAPNSHAQRCVPVASLEGRSCPPFQPPPFQSVSKQGSPLSALPPRPDPTLPLGGAAPAVAAGQAAGVLRGQGHPRDGLLAAGVRGRGWGAFCWRAPFFYLFEG